MLERVQRAGSVVKALDGEVDDAIDHLCRTDLFAIASWLCPDMIFGTYGTMAAMGHCHGRLPQEAAIGAKMAGHQ